MNKFIQFIKRNKYNIVTLGFGAAYFVFLVVISDPTYGDWQSQSKTPLSLGYGIDLWFNWSSRFFIENAVNIFSKSLPLWSLVTIGLGTMLFWGMGRILRNKNIYQSIIIFCLMLLVNINMLSTAGIFATTINYLWPMACFTFVAAIILVPFKNKKLNLISNIMIWPMFVFAVCSEQMAVLGFLFMGGLAIYYKSTKKKVPGRIYILLLLSMVGILNVIICPGNAVRAASEMKVNWPSFIDFDIKSKLTIGGIVTFSRIFFAPELLALLLVLSIGALSYKKKNLKAFIAILPAVVACLLLFFPPTEGEPTTYIRSANFFNHIRNASLYLSPDALPNSTEKTVYIIIFTLITLSVVASILYLYGRTKKSLIMLCVLSAGTLVSMVVSLSPSLFASNIRTLYPLVVILIGVNFVIIQDILKLNFNISTQRIAR